MMRLFLTDREENKSNFKILGKVCFFSKLVWMRFDQAPQDSCWVRAQHLLNYFRLNRLSDFWARGNVSLVVWEMILSN